jgi:hypothetical protein
MYIYFLLIIFILFFINNTCEGFSNSILQSNKYVYHSTHFNEVDISEKAYNILQQTKINTKLLNQIDNKILEVYDDIKTNNELKNYLKFMNLINDDGYIFFSNENPDVYLFTKIKILLIIFPQNDLLKII